MTDILIPWMTGTDCRYRDNAKTWCVNWWERAGLTVVEATGVSRSAARNNAAASTAADVLVFADADTACTIEQVETAVNLARSSGRVVQAYDQLVKWHRGYKPGNSLPRRASGPTFRGCPLGVAAVPRHLFEAVGGFDERFKVWAGEDRAFIYATEVFAGPALRVDGLAHHWWHPTPVEVRSVTDEYKANVRLAARYKRAAGHVHPEGVLPRTDDAVLDRDVMLAILGEPGGPLDPQLDPPAIGEQQPAGVVLQQE